MGVSGIDRAVHTPVAVALRQHYRGITNAGPRGCRYFKDLDTRLPRVWNMNLMLTVPHAALWARLLPDARVIHYTIFKASARCPEQNVSMQGLLP